MYEENERQARIISTNRINALSDVKTKEVRKTSDSGRYSTLVVVVLTNERFRTGYVKISVPVIKVVTPTTEALGRRRPTNLPTNFPRDNHQKNCESRFMVSSFRTCLKRGLYFT